MNDLYSETIAELNTLKEAYDLELLEELVNIFVSQKNSLIDTWTNNQNFSLEELAQCAHKIKSSARNVGAKKVGAILEKIERKPTECNSKDTILEIEKEFNFFIKTFHEWKNKGKPYE